GLGQIQVKIDARSQTENPAQPSKSAFRRFWNKTKDELPGLKGAGWTQEVWTLDLPQPELEILVASLRTDGFFTQENATTATTTLSLWLDGNKTSKNWRQVRDLDDLIARVRTDGRLVTSALPPDRERTRQSQTVTKLKKLTTLQAYRDVIK